MGARTDWRVVSELLKENCLRCVELQNIEHFTFVSGCCSCSRSTSRHTQRHHIYSSELHFVAAGILICCCFHALLRTVPCFYKSNCLYVFLRVCYCLSLSISICHNESFHLLFLFTSCLPSLHLVAVRVAAASAAAAATRKRAERKYQ